MSAELDGLAVFVSRKLNAIPATDAPARAVFDRGTVYMGSGNEFPIVVDGAGCLFISLVAGTPVIEGAATKNGGESRQVMRARHRALRDVAIRVFGDRVQFRDPLGHLSGVPEQTS